MHTFISNSSVTYNAVTQESDVLKGELYIVSAGEMTPGTVSIEVNFTANSNGIRVHSESYSVSEEDFNAFEGTLTLSATSSLERFEEVCSRYVISQIGNMWGLTTSDWTLQEH